MHLEIVLDIFELVNTSVPCVLCGYVKKYVISIATSKSSNNIKENNDNTYVCSSAFIRESMESNKGSAN